MPTTADAEIIPRIRLSPNLKKEIILHKSQCDNPPFSTTAMFKAEVPGYGLLTPGFSICSESGFKSTPRENSTACCSEEKLPSCHDTVRTTVIHAKSNQKTNKVTEEKVKEDSSVFHKSSSCVSNFSKKSLKRPEIMRPEAESIKNGMLPHRFGASISAHWPNHTKKNKFSCCTEWFFKY